MGAWLKALRYQKSKRGIKFNAIKILQIKRKYNQIDTNVSFKI